MKKKKKKKKSIIYPSIIVLSLVLSITFLLVHKYITREEKILWGKSTSNFEVDYKVYNNDNNFYEEEYLNEYGSYITLITEKIDFSIKYYFETTKNLDIDYTYNLTGEVLAEVYESGVSTPIWSKELDINMEDKKEVGNSNYLQLDKKISIPFKKYNDMMSDFKSNYKINVLSYIKFTILVEINSLENINSNLSNIDKLTITIPLLQPTYMIDINKTVSNNRDIYLQTKNDSKIFLILGISGVITTIINSLILFIIYKKSKTKIEIYNEKINNILKKYEQIIIKVETIPNIDGLETITITDFNDLIDLEETLKNPIMYINIKQNKESWFILIHNNYLYKYIINI